MPYELTTTVVEQTRWKSAIFFCIVVFVEAMVKAFLTTFPFESAIIAQGAGFGLYGFLKSTTDIKNPEGELNNRKDPLS